MRNWQASPTFQMQAGTFTALVQNGEYNQVARMLFTVNRIDVSPPTISAINGNPGSWVNTDVTLTINAQDTECGLAAAPYSFDNGATWQSSQSKAFSVNTSNIIAKVRDSAGNITALAPVAINRIDKEIPSITNIYFLKRKETLTKSIMTMFNKQVDIEIRAADIGGSAISKIEYQLVPNGSAEDTAGWLVYNDAARPIIERRFNGKIHARCI
ncbi:MAG: hypothetical protein RR573_11395, partial [Oscillospiraceae bacterium]